VAYNPAVSIPYAVDRDRVRGLPSAKARIPAALVAALAVRTLWAPCAFCQAAPDVARAEAAGAAFLGTDVLAVGTVREEGGGRPVSWRNGEAVGLAVPLQCGGGEALCVAVSDGHVYVGGSVTEASRGRKLPAVWMDGACTLLPLGQEDPGGVVQDIAAAGGAVLAAGWTGGGEKPVPTLWRNGERGGLPTLEGYANGAVMAVGGDGAYAAGVLIAGDGRLLPVLWKDAKAAALPCTEGRGGGALSMAVDGDDVYVAGMAADAAGVYRPAGWRNGELVVLPVPEGSGAGAANAVRVSAGDVHAAGYFVDKDGRSVPAYWRNGLRVDLPDGGAAGMVLGAAASGAGGVLVGRTERDRAGSSPALWDTDGIREMPLPAAPGGTDTALAAAAAAHYEAFEAGSGDAKEEAAFRIAEDCEKAGRQAEAASWYLRLFAMDGRLLAAAERLARIRFWTLSMPDAAMEPALAAERLGSADPEVYYGICLFYARRGETESALRYLAKASYFAFTRDGAVDWGLPEGEADLAVLRATQGYAKLGAGTAEKRAFADLDLARRRGRDADALLEKQDYPGAVALYGDELAALDAVGLADGLDAASVRARRGRAEAGLFLSGEAIADFQKAASLWAGQCGEAQPFVMDCLLRAAEACYGDGDFGGGLRFAERAAGIAESVLRPADAKAAEAYGAVAEGRLGKGDYGGAVESYGTALERLRRAAAALEASASPARDGRDDLRLRMARATLRLAACHRQAGDPGRAVPLAEQALGILTEILGSDDPRCAAAYGDLGACRQAGGDLAGGDLAGAAACFLKAAEICAKALGPDAPEAAPHWSALAAVRFLQGDLAGSRDGSLEAIRLWIGAYGEASPQVAAACGSLGDVAEALKDGKASLDWFRRALDAARGTGDGRLIAGSAVRLGRALAEGGGKPEALEAYREAVTAMEGTRGSGSSDPESYYRAIAAGLEAGDLEGAFATSELLRTRAFLDAVPLRAALSVEGVPAAARERLLALEGAIGSLERRREEQLGRPLGLRDGGRLAGIEADLEGKRREFAEAEKELPADGLYAALRNPRSATLKEAQGLCGADAAILSYTMWDGGPSAPDGSAVQPYCLVIRRDRVTAVRLERAYAYAEAVADLRERLLRADAGWRDRAEELRARLIAPLEPSLSGVKRLTVVPDGPLAYLPFDVLPDGGAYLCEGYLVGLAPSVSVMASVRGRDYGTAAGRTFLGFGAVPYGGGAAGSSAASGRSREYYASRAGADGLDGYYRNLGIAWPELPGSLREMETVLWDVYGQTLSVAIEGPEAGEGTLKKMSRSGELAGYPLVHFALHGRFDPEFPSASALVFSEAAGPEGRQGAEDGYLSVAEAAGLRLRADMVTLSTCQAGAGKPAKGEGLTDLPRAFLLAGANRVAVSLWQVDEAAAREFMVRMYEQLEQEGRGFAEAMSLTKREFLHGRDFPDPRFWAAFTLYGE